MSFSKRAFEKFQEQLFSEPDEKYVCESCITEPYLVEKLSEYPSTSKICSYCGNPNAFKLNALCELIQSAIQIDYTDPAEVLPYETKEGGYQGSTLDGNEIVQEHLVKWTDNDDLLVDVGMSFICASLCERNYFGLDENQVLNYGWDDFKKQVKHKTRYLFFNKQDEDKHLQEMHPSEILQRLGELINVESLYTTLPSKTVFYRARVINKNEYPSSPEELGSPPEIYTVTSNRMSAAGISEFYAGEDEATSVVETFDPVNDDGNKKIVIANFENMRDLLLIDLTKTLDIPSSFDPESAKEREILLFLVSLINDFTKPIIRDDKTHIEYVPTQVFTEYIKYKFRTFNNDSIDGIIYKSSKKNGNNAMVIFADSDGCCPGKYNDSQFLELVSHKYFATAKYLHLY